MRTAAIRKEDLTPIRLEIALALLESNEPETKKMLKLLAETDSVVANVLKVYGVEVK